MNKSVDLALIRRALRGKQLLGFKLGRTSKTGRGKTGAVKVGVPEKSAQQKSAHKIGNGKPGLSKRAATNT